MTLPAGTILKDSTGAILKNADGSIMVSDGSHDACKCTCAPGFCFNKCSFAPGSVKVTLPSLSDSCMCIPNSCDFSGYATLLTNFNIPSQEVTLCRFGICNWTKKIGTADFYTTDSGRPPPESCPSGNAPCGLFMQTLGILATVSFDASGNLMVLIYAAGNFPTEENDDNNGGITFAFLLWANVIPIADLDWDCEKEFKPPNLITSCDAFSYSYDGTTQTPTGYPWLIPLFGVVDGVILKLIPTTGTFSITAQVDVCEPPAYFVQARKCFCGAAPDSSAGELVDAWFTSEDYNNFTKDVFYVPGIGCCYFSAFGALGPTAPQDSSDTLPDGATLYGILDVTQYDDCLHCILAQGCPDFSQCPDLTANLTDSELVYDTTGGDTTFGSVNGSWTLANSGSGYFLFTSSSDPIYFSITVNCNVVSGIPNWTAILGGRDPTGTPPGIEGIHDGASANVVIGQCCPNGITFNLPATVNGYAGGTLVISP